LTEPEAGIEPAVLFEETVEIGKSTRTLDNSEEALEACPYTLNTSIISASPILEPVPLVVKAPLKAFVMVFVFVEKYLFIPII
jgi:hypothetical protein